MYLEIVLINSVNPFFEFIKSLELDRQDWAKIILSGIFTLGGAFLGALFSGLYAINSVKKQLVYDQKTRKHSDIEEYLKVSYLYQSYLNSAIQRIKDLEEDYGVKIYDIPMFSNQLEADINSLSEDIKYIIKELEKVNLNNISYDYYKTYLNSLEALRIIAELSNRDYIVEDSGVKKGYFETAVDTITSAGETIKESNQNLEDELKTLKKYFKKISKK